MLYFYCKILIYHTVKINTEIYPQQLEFMVSPCKFPFRFNCGCILEPIQTICILSKFILRPDILQFFSNSSNVLFKDSFEPSKNIAVSSANCVTLNFVSFENMPFIFLFFLIEFDRHSAHMINK